jgi:hypothetical protein
MLHGGDIAHTRLPNESLQVPSFEAFLYRPCEGIAWVQLLDLPRAVRVCGLGEEKPLPFIAEEFEAF